MCQSKSVGVQQRSEILSNIQLKQNYKNEGGLITLINGV